MSLIKPQLLTSHLKVKKQPGWVGKKRNHVHKNPDAFVTAFEHTMTWMTNNLHKQMFSRYQCWICKCVYVEQITLHLMQQKHSKYRVLANVGNLALKLKQLCMWSCVQDFRKKRSDYWDTNLWCELRDVSSLAALEQSPVCGTETNNNYSRGALAYSGCNYNDNRLP